MIILIILVTIRNTYSNTYNTILAKRIIVFAFDEAKMNEKLSELKTWLLSSSYPLAFTETIFFNAKLQGLATKKEEIVIPFLSTH